MLHTGDRYLRTVLTVAGAFVAAVGGINYTVDPYGIYHDWRIEGLNEIKPQAEEHDSLVKAHAIENLRPKGLILGNSRTEVGLDPEHAAFPSSARPVYNAGLEGTKSATALRYLKHALTVGSPRLVIVGVDFLNFLVDPAPTVASKQWSREVEERGNPVLDQRQRIRDVVDTLFSLDALLDSVKTVIAQTNPYAPDMTRLGLVTMREYVPITRRLGYAALFLQKDKDYANYLRGKASANFVQDGRSSPQLETLAQLIELSRVHRIQLILVIYPYHAHVLELLDAAGLWNDFEAWKRELVKILAHDAEVHPESTPIPLWDFSGYNLYTTERVPAQNDLTSEMRWYRDPGHFKKELGDLLLARVLGSEDQKAAPSTFGVLLNAANIERGLAHTGAERDRYREEHPDVLPQMLQLMGKPISQVRDDPSAKSLVLLQ